MGSRSPKLYWCSGGEGGRDGALEWFVVADCARDARRFFAVEAGCGDDEVTTLLAFIMSDAEAAEGWPSARTLESCGVRFLRMRFGMELVEFGGKLYRAPSVTGPARTTHRPRHRAAHVVH